ncbi:uncharacterized protein LOC34622814 [Cyclospora cayetanensis]|uniref:Uncharacterized protein LOC34622814 n=1 Tax=Cyclospora cayetanensis TaxID=88456 RepID=A0A6P6S2G1_9EIME|nr:uncharacterized protein LOC34622814 [Cyclospora cayetanensis]
MRGVDAAGVAACRCTKKKGSRLCTAPTQRCSGASECQVSLHQLLVSTDTATTASVSAVQHCTKMADRDRSSGAPLRQAMQGQGASAHPLPPAARRAAQGANTPQATETAGRRGEERYFEAATAHANARVEPPLASCTLLIGRRYVLVVGSTDRLVRSPEDPLDEMHDSILERDGKGWKRLHSLLLIHKQPALYQRQHLQQQCTRRLQQQHLHQYCFSRPPTWERIGEKLMSTPEADRCLRQTLQWLQEEPEQRLRAAGLIGFLQLLCGFHLVVGIGARPAARLLLHHTVWSLEDITLLPLFFVVDTAQEAAPYCCSLPPTLSLLHHLCHASGEHEPRHRAQDRVYEQQVQALSAALADVSFPSGAAAAAAAAEDAKYRAAVLAYRADRWFYFCRTLCINLSLQQLAARRAAARAAAAAQTAAAGAQAPDSSAAAAAATVVEFHGQFLSCELQPDGCSCRRRQSHQAQQEQPHGSSRWRWTPLHREECRFLWNRELLSLLFQQHAEELISEGFFLLILHGSVQQQVLPTQGVHLQLLTICRRSAAFAGPRYRKRGLNDAGDAANEVEVEFACQATMPSRAATLTAAQAVALAPEETAALPDGLWRQVLLHGGGGFECAIASHTDVNWSAIRRHMASLLQRYGSPLLLVNLLRSSPRKSVAAAASQTSPRAGAASASLRGAEHPQVQQWQTQQQPGGRAAGAAAAAAESSPAVPVASLDDWYSEEAAATATIAEQEAHLGEEYRRAVDVLNAELPPSVQLRFAAVDVEAARRVNPRGASKRVEALAAETLNDLQFFASNESASQLPVEPAPKAAAAWCVPLKLP